MGKMFAGLEILGTLGQGGMGVVYKARDPGVDRVVALKVLTEQTSADARERFKREVTLTSKLRHPNIVRLYKVGQVKGRLFLCMDYVEGKTMKELVAEGASQPEMVVCLQKVAHAIHYAHEQGIIHRDLKPTNIIVARNGEPIVTDFGVARELGGGPTLTMTGEAIGTAQYMPPEQARGELDRVGPTSDVYGLGAILYEVLTGRPPFEGSTEAAVLQAVCRIAPVRPRKRERGVSPGLERACLTCLQKDPRDRYQTAEALADDLGRYLSGKRVRGTRPGLGRLFVKAAMRCASYVALIALGLALTMATRRYLTPKVGDHPPQHRSTQRQAGLPSALGSEHGQVTEGNAKSQLEARISSYHAAREARCIAASADEVWWGAGRYVYRLDLTSDEIAARPVRAMQSPVRDIIRDEDGKWWFATMGAGVFSFDGTTWKNYRQVDGLARDDVNAIAIDPGGRMWFATEGGGISCFDGKKWKNHRGPPGYLHRYIRSIAADAQGRVWVVTVTTPACFDGKACVSYSLPVHSLRSAVRDRHVWAIARDGRGRMWFGIAGGAVCFDGTTWQLYAGWPGHEQHAFWCITFEPRTQTTNGFSPATMGVATGLVGRDLLFSSQWRQLPAPTFRAIAEDSRGRMWFATSSGAVCSDGETWRTYTREHGLASDSVWALALDGRHGMWAATTAGVSHFDGKTWTSCAQQGMLASDEVNAIVVDARGRKWFGTREGLCCFDNRTWQTYTTNDGLASDLIYALSIDQGGRLWIGTDRGVSCLDGEDWQTYSEADGLPSNQVSAIASDSQGNVWIGTVLGVSRFDGRTWSNFTVQGGVEGSGVHGMAVDKGDRLWLAIGKGAARFDGETWQTFSTDDGLAHPYVCCVAVDGRGRAWLGTGGRGVSCFGDGEWKTHYYQLAHGTVYAIALDHEDRLWFGTQEGLTCFDGKEWQTWTTRDFLTGDCVKSLAVDVDGSIWVGTTSGVSHLEVVAKR